MKLAGGEKRQKLNVKVIALEKNPNAVLFLESLAANEASWINTVDVVSSDMRAAEIKDNEKADIIVSELLGSFGDNELSPECLDGAQFAGLMKDGCVSIQLTTLVTLPPSLLRDFTVRPRRKLMPLAIQVMALWANHLVSLKRWKLPML